MTIAPSPRAVTFDDRAAFQAAPLASESGRSLTSADASHAIAQSPPSDVGRMDGAGKGAGVHDGGRRGEGQQSRLPIALGMALNSKVGKRLADHAQRSTA